MAGPVLLAPLVLVVVAGAVLLAVLGATATRDGRLLGTVAAAQRHGTTTGAVAVAAGVAAAAALTGSGWLSGSGSGVGVAVLPLAFALVHTGVVVAGELSWPRPHGAVRTAALAARAPATVAPAALRRLLHGGAALVVLTCAVGWLTADGSGRSLSRVVRDGAGHVVGERGHGPYPGPVFALPVLVGTAALVLAVRAGLRVVADRPAVLGADGPAERALRRASAHRLLRGAAAGVLATAAGLLVLGGLAVRGVSDASATAGVGSAVTIFGQDRTLVAAGLVAVAVGLCAAASALVVLLVPAPRVAAPAPGPDPAVAG